MHVSRTVLSKTLIYSAAAFVGFSFAAPRIAVADNHEQSVRDAIKKYEDAWNARDMKSMAACWSLDGELVDPSGQKLPVAEVLGQRASLFTHDKTSTLAVKVASIRLLTPNVAVVDGVTEFADASPEANPGDSFSALYIRRDGEWLLARVHELDAGTAVENHLQELEWLIGTWHGESEESTVRSTVTWSENKKFMIRKFEVVENDQVILTGTQRVGWDPLTGQLKSWYFDSDGSIGEGEWEKQDEHWIIDVKGMLQDGTTVSATNVYTRIDDDSYLRHSLRTRVGNQTVPDREVRVVRSKKPKS